MNNEPAIAALRIEQLLARAEQDPVSDNDLHARLDDLRQRVDGEDVPRAVEGAPEELADEYADKA